MARRLSAQLCGAVGAWLLVPEEHPEIHASRNNGQESTTRKGGTRATGGCASTNTLAVLRERLTACCGGVGPDMNAATGEGQQGPGDRRPAASCSGMLVWHMVLVVVYTQLPRMDEENFSSSVKFASACV
jgi:hypothetical protein